MSQILKKLPSEFSRVHHSFIVNHLYIKSLDKSNSNLKLKNDTVIPISRRKKEKFYKSTRTIKCFSCNS